MIQETYDMSVWLAFIQSQHRQFLLLACLGLHQRRWRDMACSFHGRHSGGSIALLVFSTRNPLYYITGVGYLLTLQSFWWNRSRISPGSFRSINLHTKMFGRYQCEEHKVVVPCCATANRGRVNQFLPGQASLIKNPNLWKWFWRPQDTKIAMRCSHSRSFVSMSQLG